MADRQDRMVPDHARSSIAHNFPDSFALLRLIAMYRAFIADRLSFPERTFCNLLTRIRQKPLAIFAEILLHAVVGTAIHADHGGNGANFKNHECDPIAAATPCQE